MSTGATPFERPIAEPQLMDYVLALWRGRLWILGAIIGVGLAAVAYSASMPNQYQAVCTVLLKPSALADPAEKLQLADVRALMVNQTLAAELVREFKLDQPPYGLTPQRFLGERLSVTPLRDSSLLQIVVTLEDPKVAADAANAIAERAVVHNNGINRAALDFVKGRRDEAYRQLRADEARLLASRQTSQLDLLRSDVDTSLGQRADLQRLMVEIEGERVRVSRLERELAQQTRVVDTSRRPDAARALLQAPEGANDTKSLDLSSGVLNPVYEVLDYQLAQARSNLAVLERRQTEMTSKLGLNAATLKQLSRLYSADIEQQRLGTEYSLSQRLYSDVSEQYEKARVRIATDEAQVAVVDRALVPSERSAPNRSLLVTSWAAVAGFVAMIATLVAAYVRRALR